MARFDNRRSDSGEGGAHMRIGRRLQVHRIRSEESAVQGQGTVRTA